MNILITGGAGYIGSHAAHQLAADGNNIIVIDDLITGFVDALPDGVRFIKGNIGDLELLKKTFGSSEIEAVLHFAASTEVEESVLNPAKYYQNNSENSRRLFELSAQHNVAKIIFSSTAAVYGGNHILPVCEKEAPKPENPYGISKLLAENMLTEACDRSNGQMKGVILRFFNVAGAHPNLKVGQRTPKASHLIKVAAEAAAGVRSRVVVHGTDYDTEDGTCERDYVHVQDIVAAHVDALNYSPDDKPTELFNVGYGRAYSVNQVLRAMKLVSGKDFSVEYGPRRKGDVASISADNSKIKKILGWKESFADLNLICESAFKWELKLSAQTKV